MNVNICLQTHDDTNELFNDPTTFLAALVAVIINAAVNS